MLDLAALIECIIIIIFLRRLAFYVLPDAKFTVSFEKCKEIEMLLLLLDFSVTVEMHT